MAKPTPTKGTVALPKRDDEKKIVIAKEQPPESYDQKIIREFQQNTLSPHYELRDEQTRAQGDIAWTMAYRDQALASGDRFGTRGQPSAQEAAPPTPERAERTQRADAKLKGSAAEAYRPEVKGVVQ
jgi:hypothetical protein